MNKQALKHLKRLTAIFAVVYFALLIRCGYIMLLATLADEVNTETEKSLSWLFPGDWVKVRAACILVGAVQIVGLGVLLSLPPPASRLRLFLLSFLY